MGMTFIVNLDKMKKVPIARGTVFFSLSIFPSLSLSLSSKKQCPFAANDEPNLQPNIENPSTREGTGVESAEKPNMAVKQYRQNKQVISIFNLFLFKLFLAEHTALFNLHWKQNSDSYSTCRVSAP